MSKRLSFLKKLGLLALLGISACQAPTKIPVSYNFSDYKRYEYNHSGNQGDGVSRTSSAPNYMAAQTFTIGSVGDNKNFFIDGVSLYLWKDGDPQRPLHVDLYNVDKKGVPKDKLFESWLNEDESWTQPLIPQWYHIPVPKRRLKKDKTYALVVWGDWGDSSNRYRWGISNNNDYPGGQRYVYGSGEAPNNWWLDAGRDYKFEVCGRGRKK